MLLVCGGGFWNRFKNKLLQENEAIFQWNQPRISLSQLKYVCHHRNDLFILAEKTILNEDVLVIINHYDYSSPSWYVVKKQ